jgi:hypothetical protein
MVNTNQDGFDGNAGSEASSGERVNMGLRFVGEVKT